jgi:rod shape determining protein RodA
MLRRAVADYPLVLVALALSMFGIAMVYSAGQTDAPNFVSGLWQRQLAFMLVGVAGALAVSQASVRVIDWLTWPFFIFVTLLLVWTVFAGTGAGTAASSKAWLTIGGYRIGQPAELAKIAVVLLLARVLASRREPPKSMLELWKPALVMGIPWALIVLQRDIGTAMVLIGIFFAMLFWAGVPWQLLVLTASPAVSLLLAFSTTLWGAWFLLLIALVLIYKPFLVEGIAIVVANVAMGIIAPILWNRLDPYQQNRFLTFLDPTEDPRGSGYHVIQSQTAIGSGGWFGQGFTEGSQKRLAFLPEQHTDFIFAVTGEELGFFGVTIALALFLVLFIRTTGIAARANDAFSSLVAFGLASSWFVHVIENVGMTINLMPITGIPLPFFSYGGSFMLASWLAIGVLVRISREGRRPAHAFDF